MSVSVNPGPALEFGAEQPLFQTGLRFVTAYTAWMNQYGVSRDGQRFLLNRSLPETTHAITAVIPW